MIGWIVVLLVLLVNFLAAGHALLYKRDPRTAWGWIVTCLLIPTIGPVLYFLLGINRIKTRARKLKGEALVLNTDQVDTYFEKYASDKHHFTPDIEQMVMGNLSQSISNRPLLGGNRVHVLFDGNEAYPDMLESISKAQKNIFLATYIFETNKTGHKFIKALGAARQRGVDVRVMLDGVGEYYSWPRVGRYLKKSGIPFTRFLPPKLIPLSPFINLRNHRKMLIIDDNVAYTGGMNIGDRHLVDELKGIGARDIQFKLTGPVVSQMKDVFMEDWSFCKGIHLPAVKNRSFSDTPGSDACRIITVGPNQDIDKLRMLFTGMVSQARNKIFIMTPYFLPSHELVGAIQVAALKGVEVNIVLPAKNNLPYVHWATQNMLWEILQYKVNVYFQPPPFSHSKLFVIDEIYSIIGSANMDPRSLRLNFEMVAEIYSKDLAVGLIEHFEDRISKSKRITLADVDSRSVPVRLRDSICWLFSPYL
ncbi:MAG: cardiolipin synthase [Desulfovibrionales bacterium]|nr:cardiolipin synthase [Desulfovibrionales bacterium]